MAALGAVGGIIKSSHTVGEALTIAATFTAVVTDAVRMEVLRTERDIRVGFIQEAPDNSVIARVTDFLMVFTINELDGLLLRKIKPLAVNVPTISNAVEYERAFRCTPTKGTDYSIFFDGNYWDVPIITANYELQQSLLEKASNSRQTSSDNSFKDKITDYVCRNAHLGLLSLEDVAANFNITPRSLQRRLREESVTFQELSDHVRKSIALNYLSTGKYQVKEISAILGYNELSASSRAFKRWTGQTPLEYQA